MQKMPPPPPHPPRIQPRRRPHRAQTHPRQVAKLLRARKHSRQHPVRQFEHRHERHLRPCKGRALRCGDPRLRQFLRRQVEGPEAEAGEGEGEEEDGREDGEGQGEAGRGGGGGGGRGWKGEEPEWGGRGRDRGRGRGRELPEREDDGDGVYELPADAPQAESLQSGAVHGRGGRYVAVTILSQ